MGYVDKGFQVSIIQVNKTHKRASYKVSTEYVQYGKPNKNDALDATKQDIVSAIDYCAYDIVVT